MTNTNTKKKLPSRAWCVLQNLYFIAWCLRALVAAFWIATTEVLTACWRARKRRKAGQTP